MRYSFIILLSLVLYGCTNDYIDDDTTPPEGSDEVTVWMDSYLSTHYLYNDEYNALTRDLTTPWNEYLDATLTKLGDNLDYKNGSYYSYIYQSSTSTYSSTMRASANYTLSFGLYFVRLDTYVYNRSTYYRIGIEALFPDSPLSEYAERGDFITQVNGQRISNLNYAYTYAYALLYAGYGATSYSLTFNDETTQTVSAAYIDPTPIIKSEVIYEDESNNKVGYIHYTSFDIDYDEDLYTKLKDLKSQDITELILDMRFNGGGYNYSSNMLSSIIAGDKGQETGNVFAKYTYNATRGSSEDKFMKVYNSENYSNLSKTIGSITDAFLSFPRLYCLVSEYTASASELVINSLRGIGVNVYLIGSQTEGKNVGMEVKTETFGSYTYEFAPITFRSENTIGYSGYENGFTVDEEADDWDNFADFTADEVMISAALTHITTSDWSSDMRSVSSSTKSSSENRERDEHLFAPSRLTGSIKPLE